MDIGMLWFDNDQKTSIPSKVARAADYYQKKYGKNPDICYVHPKTVVNQQGKADGSARADLQDQLRIGQVLVLINEKILPDHFWIGIRTTEETLS
jgi:hypothetical protein